MSSPKLKLEIAFTISAEAQSQARNQCFLKARMLSQKLWKHGHNEVGMAGTHAILVIHQQWHHIIMLSPCKIPLIREGWQSCPNSEKFSCHCPCKKAYLLYERMCRSDFARWPLVPSIYFNSLHELSRIKLCITYGTNTHQSIGANIFQELTLNMYEHIVNPQPWKLWHGYIVLHV